MDVVAMTVNGIWQGVLEVSGTEVEVVFKINEREDGSLFAAMDIPQQGALNIGVDRIRVSGKALRMDLGSLEASYQGKLDGESIKGDWYQSGQVFPLNLEKVDQAPRVARPQDPQGDLPYREEVVTVTGRDDIELEGTLTLPEGEGPFPAAHLITGSGAMDRNESIMGHRPFLVLADHLTRQGVAVLRLDDRGVGGSQGDARSSTTHDFAEDALSALSFLQGREEVDPKKVGLIGHSEGGLVAAMVASRSGEVAFAVLMTAPALPGEKVLYMQAAQVARAMGASDASVVKNRMLQERLFSALRDDEQIGAQALRKTVIDALEGMDEEEKQGLMMNEGNLQAQMEMVTSPWFRTYIRIDPREYLRKVRCPLLALFGEKDLQVSPHENARALRDALEAAGNEDYRVEVMPHLNHLLQRAKTGLPHEYGRIEETLSPKVLDLMSGWIGERFG
ncbi:MAG: alpha/beta hydrolase family protein [Methanomassiliicoccales archaeon]